jgi:hypothetical protein
MLVTLLSSKKLSKSFKQIKDANIWESMSFPIEEAQEIIKAALSKLSNNSEPLTITITVVSSK